jgi:hypothetical protein
LVWDRRVTKSGGLDNTFDPSNIFTGHDVDDLDLFLLPVGWTEPYSDSIPFLRSFSSEDNVEHIHADVEPGNYEIVVVQANGDEVDYGLAWWTGNPADFDQDGDVDDDDFNQWKGDFGDNDNSDADFDGDSDGADFLAWQQNYGSGVPALPANVPVPEPCAWMLAAIGLPLLIRRRLAA